MLVTSVSLPGSYAALWRKQQRAVMRMAVRMLRLTMRQNPVRRGVKRQYNRQPGKYEIVTTRFTEAEYDTLHAAASAMRVSVSSLVYIMLLLWHKPARRRHSSGHLTNYELDCLKWNERVGVITESITFWPKIIPTAPIPAAPPRLQMV